jgi:hypothetical protein
MSKYIDKVIKLANELSAVADEGDVNAEDKGCRVLFGIARDAAHKIRNMAEVEKEKHLRNRPKKEIERLIRTR